MLLRPLPASHTNLQISYCLRELIPESPDGGNHPRLICPYLMTGFKIPEIMYNVLPPASNQRHDYRILYQPVPSSLLESPCECVIEPSGSISHGVS